jgi:hypothetical protein
MTTVEKTNGSPMKIQDLENSNNLFPFLFFCCLPLFRLAGCGFLLLANWVLVHENNTKNGLALSVILSFAPALLVGILSKKLSTYNSIKSTGIAIVLCSLLSFVASVSHHQTVLFLLVIFLMWFLFFAIDSLSEGWFAQECQGKTSKYLHKLGGINMTITQVAVLLGPLLIAPFSKRLASSQIFVLIGFGFAISSVFSFVRSKHIYLDLKKLQKRNPDDVEKPRDEGSLKAGNFPLKILLPFALIWPCLGLFNMMTPVAAHELAASRVDYAAYVDALLALGMAFSGIVFATKSKLPRGLLIGLGVLGGVCSIGFFLMPQGQWYSYLSVLALGLGFGSARVALRKMAVETFSPQQVSRLIGKANALGFPLICMLVFFYSQNLEHLNLSVFNIGLRHAIPSLSFLTFFGLFKYLIFINHQGEK